MLADSRNIGKIYSLNGGGRWDEQFFILTNKISWLEFLEPGDFTKIVKPSICMLLNVSEFIELGTFPWVDLPGPVVEHQ